MRRRDFLGVFPLSIAPISAAEPIRFSFEIRRLKEGLLVSYAVQNNSGGEIGLFNRIPTVANNRETGFRPENTYIDFQGSALLLRKMALPLPAGINMGGRSLPYVTRVAKGETYREALRFIEPILVDDPMRLAAMAAALPGKAIKATRRREATSVIFSLGFFRSDASIRFDPVSAQYPDVYRVWPPGPPVDRQQVLTKTVSLTPSAAVMDYE